MCVVNNVCLIPLVNYEFDIAIFKLSLSFSLIVICLHVYTNHIRPLQ